MKSRGGDRRPTCDDCRPLDPTWSADERRLCVENHTTGRGRWRDSADSKRSWNSHSLHQSQQMIKTSIGEWVERFRWWKWLGNLSVDCRPLDDNCRSIVNTLAIKNTIKLLLWHEMWCWMCLMIKQNKYDWHHWQEKKTRCVMVLQVRVKICLSPGDPVLLK